MATNTPAIDGSISLSKSTRTAYGKLISNGKFRLVPLDPDEVAPDYYFVGNATDPSEIMRVLTQEVSKKRAAAYYLSLVSGSLFGLHIGFGGLRAAKLDLLWEASDDPNPARSPIPHYVVDLDTADVVAKLVPVSSSTDENLARLSEAILRNPVESNEEIDEQAAKAETKQEAIAKFATPALDEHLSFEDLCKRLPTMGKSASLKASELDTEALADEIENSVDSQAAEEDVADDDVDDNASVLEDLDED